LGIGDENLNMKKETEIIIPIISYAMCKFLLRLTPEKLKELQQFLKESEKGIRGE